MTWLGANKANITTEVKNCDLCLKPNVELRIFHSLNKEKINRNDHVAVCRKCAGRLPHSWHGCGCGG